MNYAERKQQVIEEVKKLKDDAWITKILEDMLCSDGMYVLAQAMGFIERHRRLSKEYTKFVVQEIIMKGLDHTPHYPAQKWAKTLTQEEIKEISDNLRAECNLFSWLSMDVLESKGKLGIERICMDREFIEGVAAVLAAVERTDLEKLHTVNDLHTADLYKKDLVAAHTGEVEEEYIKEMMYRTVDPDSWWIKPLHNSPEFKEDYFSKIDLFEKTVSNLPN